MRLWDRAADFFAAHRRILWGVVAGCTALAVVGLARLRFDDRPHSIFESGDEDYRLLRQIYDQFGSDDNECFLLVQSEGLFTPRGVAAVRRLVERAGQLPDVAGVVSLDGLVRFERGPLGLPAPVPLLPPRGAPAEAYERAARQAAAHPLAGGHLLSDDRRTTLVIVRLENRVDSIAQLEPVVQALERISADAAERGLRVRMTGIPPIRVEIFNAVRAENARFTAIGAVLSLAMAWLLFRRLRLVVIVSVGPMLGAVWSLGAMGLAGEPVNIINVVLPTLVIVVGFTNAIHLLIDMRHTLAEGGGELAPVQVAAEAVRHLGGACGLATLTTAIGFGSLGVSQVEVIRRFGLVCAGGALLAFLAVILTVPLLASLLLKQQPAATPKAARGPVLWCVLWSLDLVLRRPRVVAVAGTLLTLGLGATALRLRPDSQLTETLPTTSEAYRALRACDRTFGGAVTVTAYTGWDEPLEFGSPEVLAALAEAEALFDGEPEVRHPMSILEVLRCFPGERTDLSDRVGWLGVVPEAARGRLVRTDLRRAVVTGRLRDFSAAAYRQVFDRMEAGLRQIEARHPGVHLQLTGTSVVASRNINQMISDLAASLSLAGLVIFGVITAALRSPRLGAVSVVPNLFPLVLTASLLVVFGRPLQLASVIVFTICLGIAVDDTIHYLNRFRRERRAGRELSATLRRSSAAVGTALVTSTLVLVTGFGSLLLSEIPSTRLFARLSCTAIGAALVGDLLILPALLRCLAGRRGSGTAAEPARPA